MTAGPSGLVAVPAPAHAACGQDCLYVDAGAGSDANDGRSPGTAFATLARAAAAVRPGTTVLVSSGTYTTDGASNPLEITASGTADAWITFAAAPGQHPVIQIPRGGGATAGIHLFGAAFVVIDGFEIVGQNGSITADEAAANDGSQAVLNENCIYVDGMGFGGTPPPTVPHDIVVRNSVIHGCSAAGIEANVADALVIAYNRIFDNSWWTVFGTSGVGLYHLTDVPGATVRGGYKNFIVGNEVSGNRNNLPWKDGQPPAIYDGNGIIVDDANHTQPAVGGADVQGVPYAGRTYIANNVVHGNGGHGIHVFASSHVDVVNNTAYDDLQSDSPFLKAGAIDAQDCADTNVVNDVAVLLNGKQVGVLDGGAYDSNVWSGANASPLGPGDVVADPALADPAHGDFTPRAGSPALRSGTDRLAPAVDFAGKARVPGVVDRGALQVSG
jgi:parallel beta-helix repeat protein